MLKKFMPSVILIALGSLIITFSMTRQLEPTILWTLFFGGTFLNIFGIACLYRRFQQVDHITTGKPNE